MSSDIFISIQSHVDRLPDVYSLIDQLNALVRTAMDSDSSSDDLFEPFEWTLPVFLIFLEDALKSPEFET